MNSALQSFDQQFRAKGAGILAGVDEAGRGPLAGPVTAAAVIMPESADHPLINDSKKLSEKKRNEAFQWISETAVSMGVYSAGMRLIHEKNILGAALFAMEQAVARMNQIPDLILVDGPMIPANLRATGQAIVDGDAKSFSIAAASIIAKVTRDRIMVRWAEIFPGYGFEKHKGYGTQAHIDAINQLLPTPIHRLDFAPVRDFQFPRRPDRALLGRWGENQAIYALILKGYKFLERNVFVGKFGELDIVMQYQELFIIVEVKTRGAGDPYDPMEWMTKQKINHLLDATEEYFRRKGMDEYEVRLDAVMVHADNWKSPVVDHYEDIIH